MAVELIPIELDIDDALNDIETLKSRIEDAFSKHGANNDPRIEKLLQQMRNVYNTLGDVQQRMGDINFDPSIESTLKNVREDISNLQTSLQQARENAVNLEQSFKNMNFDPNLDDRMQTLTWIMNNTSKAIDESRSKITQLQPSEEQIQEWNTLQDSIEKTLNSLHRSQELQSKALERAEAQGINWENPEGYTKIYLRLSEEIKATKADLNELLAKERELEQQGFASPADAKTIQEEEAKIQSLTEKLEGLKQQKAEVQKQVTARDSMAEQIEQSKHSIQSYEDKLKNLQQSEKELQQQQTAQDTLARNFQKASDSANVLDHRLNQITESNNRASRSTNNLKSTFDGIKKAVSNIFSHIKSFAKSVASHIKSVMSSLLSHIKSIAKSIGHSLSSKFSSLGKSSKGLTGSLEGGFKKAFKVLLKYGLGVRSLFFLFRKLRSAAMESLGEMAKQIPEVNKQMSEFKKSMNQMKGSLGTMIQPLLTILVPAMQKVASVVTKVTESIASFIALLTGQSYIISATANEVDYAKSLDKSGKSAKKAKKELEGYLSPIDEINKYKSKDKDDDNDDSDATVKYKKKPISDAMKKFLDWIRDMWKKADFTDLGKYLGEKLLSALKKIPWAKIKQNARKLGKSLATLIGGFIKVPGLAYEIGKTLAEAFNTAFEFLNEFVHNLPWKEVGEFIADFFNGVFESLNWDLIYDTVVTGLDGLAEALWGFINKFNWDNISNFISNAINTLSAGLIAFFTKKKENPVTGEMETWAARLGRELGDQLKKSIQKIKWQDVGEALGAILKSIIDFAVNFVMSGPGWEDLKTAIHDLVMGFLKGLGLNDEQIETAMSWVNTVEEIFANIISILSTVWDAIQPLVAEIASHLVEFLKNLPTYLNNIKESSAFQRFVDWLKSLTWDDIKKGLGWLSKGLIAVAAGFAAFKGITAIGKVATAISSITSLFGGGGGVGAVAAGGGGGGGGALAFLKIVTVITAIILALGALKQIPGFEWLVKEGLDMVKTLLTGIAEVIGSTISSIGVGLTSGLPQMGANLSEFAKNLQPFIDAVKQLDGSAIEGVASLAGMILALTTADVINGLTSWFTGGNSMIKFGEQISQFAPYLKQFADGVKGIDGTAVESAANAGKALAEMAQAIPNEGGWISKIFGENNLDTFGEQLVVFGRSIKRFGNAVKGLDKDVVENAASAGKAVTNLADTVPNTGGWAADIFGDNTLDTFGEQLVVFGRSMKKFSVAVKGLDANAVEQAAIAGESLTKLNDTVPNCGGLISYIVGENNLDTFGEHLVAFGKGLNKFYNSVKNIDTKLISQVATVGSALAKMNEMIPDTDGIVTWFTGDKDLDDFGEDLVDFGRYIKKFSDTIDGIDTKLINNAAIAGKALAEMAQAIPNGNGLVVMFTGDNDIDDFGEQLPAFGTAMKQFSDNLKGISPSLVTESAIAGKSVAEMARELPNQDGLVSLFSGNNNMEYFEESLPKFGVGLKGFSDAVDGIKPDVVINASNAGKAVAQMAKELPNEGGWISDMFGENRMDTFADQLPKFGKAIKKFAERVNGLDSSVIDNAVYCGKAVAQMASELPLTGGVIEEIFGNNDMDLFGKQLASFGKSIKDFANEVGDINSADVDNGVSAGKALADMATYIPYYGSVFEFFTGNNNMDVFGRQLVMFGNSLRQYSEAISAIDDISLVEKSAQAGKALADMASSIPKMGSVFEFFSGTNDMATFGNSLIDFGNSMVRYSNIVGGVATDVVTKTTIAISALVALSKDLPTVGGVKSWFKGKSDFATFGKNLSKFGETMVQFSDLLKNIQLNNVSAVINGCNRLIDLAKMLTTTDTQSLVTFAKDAKIFANQFSNVSIAYVSDFLAQFINAKDRVDNAITIFMNFIMSDIKSYDEKLISLAQQLVDSFLNDGIVARKTEFNTTGKNMAESIISGFIIINKGLTTSFQGAVNSLKRVWNDFADWMNKRLDIEIDTKDAFGQALANSIGVDKLKIGRIPRLAQGAVIPPNKEFMAVLGDQNRGTNIETPLSTMVDAFNQALAMNGGANQKITLNLMLPDKRTIAQYAIEGGQILQSSRGYNPFMLERE